MRRSRSATFSRSAARTSTRNVRRARTRRGSTRGRSPAAPKAWSSIPTASRAPRSSTTRSTTIHPRPNGRYVAIGTAEGGSEKTTLHVVDARTGRLLPDVIERAIAIAPSWRDDGRSFYYFRTPPARRDQPERERDTKGVSAAARAGSRSRARPRDPWLRGKSAHPVRARRRGRRERLAANALGDRGSRARRPERGRALCRTGSDGRQSERAVAQARRLSTATSRVPLLNGQPLRPMFGGRVTSTENQVLVAHRTKIQAPYGTSSHLVSWLDTACNMLKADRSTAAELVSASAEALSEGYAASIRRAPVELKAPNARLIQGMSSTELKSGGFRDCDENSGLHVDPQHFFIEMIDPKPGCRQTRRTRKCFGLEPYRLARNGHPALLVGRYHRRRRQIDECPKCPSWCPGCSRRSAGWSRISSRSKARVSILPNCAQRLRRCSSEIPTRSK